MIMSLKIFNGLIVYAIPKVSFPFVCFGNEKKKLHNPYFLSIFHRKLTLRASLIVQMSAFGLHNDAQLQCFII